MPALLPEDEPKRNAWCFWLLLLPVAALVFPGLYNRQDPAWMGIPFFYWYQLLWVFLATAILGLVYQLQRPR